MMRKFVYIYWVFFLCLPVALLSYSWSFTEVDSPMWDFAFAASITTDDNGVIHILYDRGAIDTCLALRHGVWDGNTQSFTLETVDSLAGIDNDIAIDGNGNIHIAYCYVDNFSSFDFDLYYGYYDGTWHTEALETSGMATGYPCHIAVDGNNHPHIAGSVSLSPKYFYYDGSTWHNQSVPNVLDPGGIAIDTRDHPFISAAINPGNCAAYYDGSSWSLDTLETGAACATNSMTMDDLGNLHVAYRYTGSGNHLKYAHFYGSTCSTVVVDDNGNTGINPSIAVDCNNQPHISYYSNTEGCLKIASWNGSNWEIEVVDNTGDVGRYSSLVMANVDGTDYPFIVYSDATPGNTRIKFAYDENSLGIETPSFSADANPGSITLTWRIASQHEVVRYLIERKSSGESGEYSQIHSIPGPGSTPSPETYSYEDGDVRYGVRYFYKLGVVTIDGNTKWYGPVSATILPMKPEIQIAPNPFIGTVTVNLGMYDTELTIYDASGRLVKSIKLEIDTYQLGSDLIPGVYFLKARVGNYTETKKIIKIR